MLHRNVLELESTIMVTNNDTHSYKHASSFSPELYGLTYAQVILAVIGLMANLLTLLTFMYHHSRFSPAICLLLKHQSVLDGSVCLLSIPLLLQPPSWSTGVRAIDVFFCHVWCLL